jgi:hypothetical protein
MRFVYIWCSDTAINGRSKLQAMGCFTLIVRLWLLIKALPWLWNVEQQWKAFSLLPEHLSSPPVFSGVRVTRSLDLYICFVDCCLSFCTFYFAHCVVCSSSLYGLWLPLWYVQTRLSFCVLRVKLIVSYLHLCPIIKVPIQLRPVKMTLSYNVTIPWSYL